MKMKFSRVGSVCRVVITDDNGVSQTFDMSEIKVDRFEIANDIGVVELSGRCPPGSSDEDSEKSDSTAS